MSDTTEAEIDNLSDTPPTEAEWNSMHRLTNVKKLRERIGISQEQFAETYRIPLETLRDWEQKRKSPDATARRHLEVIDRDPD
jgi:putative transcriptional regulator